jgi:hypothetical protein
MAGTFVAPPNLQALLLAIDAPAVVAAPLLAQKYFRTGHVLIAAAE